MSKLLDKVNRRTNFSFAATFIAASYLASRFLGLLRDRLLAAHFGIGAQADAYTAAFRLPDLIFTLLVSGAFAVAFIPVFTAHWTAEEKEKAWDLTSSMITILALATLVICGLVFVFVGPVTHLIAPGFDPYRAHLTAHLTRIMLVTPVFFAVSSVVGSVQQAFNRFVFFALSGVFYNLGIIFGIVFLSHGHSIYGVAYGVVIGAALQGIVQVLGLFGLGFRFRPRLNLRDPGVRRVISLVIPRSLDQGIDQINYSFQTIIGSKLATGSLTAFYYASNLREVPLAIFGTAIATAAFPGLASKAAKKDKTGLVKDFVFNARLILFLVVPSAAAAVVLRGYIIRLLFGFGNATTANTLGWFSASIVFQSIFFLVTRMYYSLQDSKTPLFTSIFAIGLNIILSLKLAPTFGIAGLAAAQSITSGLELTALVFILRPKLPSLGLRQIWSGLSRMLIATVIMTSLLYIAVAELLPLYDLDRGFRVIAPKFGLIVIIGAIGYLVPCYALRLPEAHSFMRKLKTQLLRPLSLPK